MSFSQKIKAVTKFSAPNLVTQKYLDCFDTLLLLDKESTRREKKMLSFIYL